MRIRLAEEADWPDLWNIIAPVFREGQTYVFDPNISESDARRVWIEDPSVTFIAEGEDNEILGTYYLKPNQPGLGSHVCNCGYVVAEHARGKGIASQLCVHSQKEAVARGFRAMQFNLVVKTNEGAIRLWKKHGFEIVGTLPGAFRHATLGYTDAYIMYRVLDSSC